MILQKTTSGLSEASLSRFVLRARRAARLHGRVNLLVTSSRTMRALNARFRGKDTPTDVLSFPAGGMTEKRKRNLAGEIAISAEIAAQNAVRLGHSVAAEVKVLALHGLLHLAGMDHERDNGQMARREAALRRALRLPVALTERTQERTSLGTQRKRRRQG